MLRRLMQSLERLFVAEKVVPIFAVVAVTRCIYARAVIYKFSSFEIKKERCVRDKNGQNIAFY